MKYIFKAKKGVDKIVEGKIEAASQDAAVAKIIEQGLVPILVTEEGKYAQQVSTGRPSRAIFQLPFGEKVTGEHVYLFTKKLRILLRSQLPILNSLYILKDQITNRNFKKIIGNIIDSVREGASFSEALTKFPHLFPPLYLSIIKAGEASGKLDNSLDQITKYLSDERQISQKVKSSLAYPALMIVVGLATIVFILTFVVPKLKVLFEDLVEKLPFVTKVLLNISIFFSRYWLWMLLLSILFGIFLFYTRGASWQKRFFYGIRKKTPVVNKIIYNQSLCRFARGLSILLSSGITVLNALKIATPLVDDYTGQEELERAYKQVFSGGGLEESFKNNCTFLPDMFTRMVAIGEASGRLDEILAELADSYAEEVDAMTKVVTSLIEPIAILLVGSILGFIVIAVLLPIFEISFYIR